MVECSSAKQAVPGWSMTERGGCHRCVVVSPTSIFTRSNALQGLEHWNAFDQAFRQLLAERGIEFQVVPRDVTRIDERVRIVIGDS